MWKNNKSPPGSVKVELDPTQQAKLMSQTDYTWIEKKKTLTSQYEVINENCFLPTKILLNTSKEINNKSSLFCFLFHSIWKSLKLSPYRKTKLILVYNKNRGERCWKENELEHYLQVMAKVSNGWIPKPCQSVLPRLFGTCSGAV